MTSRPADLPPDCSRNIHGTLAHAGTLFLDGLPEFVRNALDALRQPLEQGVVTIARVHGRIPYPARFQLVAAMNPAERCPRRSGVRSA